MIEILTGPHAGKIATVEIQGARRYSARKFFVIRDKPKADGAPSAPGSEIVHPLPDALRGLAMVEEINLTADWWRYAVAVLSLGLLSFVAEGKRWRRYTIRFTQEYAFDIATDDRVDQKMLASIDTPMSADVPHHAAPPPPPGVGATTPAADKPPAS